MSKQQIHEIAELVSALELPPMGDEADWLGRLDKVIADLRDKRRVVIDELDAPMTGFEYKIEESRSAKRTYNTAAILKQFDSKGWTLHQLLAMDAVRLSWRWTELRKAYQVANLDLTVAAREVSDAGDLDEAPVGEVWSTRYAVKGVE